MLDDRNHAAILRMLIRRATLLDRLNARVRRGHWLNCGRADLRQLEAKSPDNRQAFGRLRMTP